jgi:hypothetical protein
MRTDIHIRNLKLSKIHFIISHLNNKPTPPPPTDQPLTLWKAHLSSKHYLAIKSLQFRIKTYELCGSHRLLCSFLDCTDKATQLNVASIQIKSWPLYSGWLNLSWNSQSGGTISANWLCKNASWKTLSWYVETTSETCPEVKENLMKGSIIAQHSQLISVIKWYGKKTQLFLLTILMKPELWWKEMGKNMPTCMSHCNRLTDKVDHLLQSYLVERKHEQVTHKLFHQHLNTTFFNFLNIYRGNTGRNTEKLC